MLVDALNIWYRECSHAAFLWQFSETSFVCLKGQLSGFFVGRIGFCLWQPSLALILTIHHSVMSGIIGDLDALINSQHPHYRRETTPTSPKRFAYLRRHGTIASRENAASEETESYSQVTTNIIDAQLGRQFFPTIELPKTVHQPAKLKLYMTIQYWTILLAGLSLGGLCSTAIAVVYGSIGELRTVFCPQFRKLIVAS